MKARSGRARLPYSFLVGLSCRLIHQHEGVASANQIVVVPKMRAAEAFYGLTREGCEDRVRNDEYALANNINCNYTGSWEPNVEENIRILEELIDDPSVFGISVSVLDTEAYTPVINRCIAQGKPIITFDSDAPESDRLAYVGTDNYAMGRELAKLLKQIKPDGGTFGVVSGFGDNLQKRVQGVRDGLQEDGVWIEVSNSPKNGLEDTAVSLEKMWELVEEYPDLGAVVSVVGLPMFNPNTTDWKHFVDSNRDVLTIIADTLPVQLTLMQKSYVDALVGQLPYNMGYQSADVLLQAFRGIVDEGVPLDETLPTDIVPITHQLEVLRIPLELPPLDFNYNYLGNIAIVGYVLCAIIVGASLGLMGWTWHNRHHSVVKSSQPIFLAIICVGTLLMGSAIIPLSIDDETSQEAADIACMSWPWLIFTGFTVAFAALFSKTWRLNKIFLSKNPLRRIKVTEKDVILPLVLLVAMNTITLICWTAIAPLRFVRTLEEGTDPWNRSLGSYGHCRSADAGGSIPYLVVIGTITTAALVIANFQAYRARNVRTEFNESVYIAMGNASFLQAILTCLPVIFLTRESPQAYFIVLSVVLFILSSAILVCMFVPKMHALKNFAANRASRRSVIISGMALGRTNSGLTATSGSGRRSSQSSLPSSNATMDPVASLLQHFQSLSYRDKSAAMKKLGAAHGPPAKKLDEDEELAKVGTEEEIPAAQEVTATTPEIQNYKAA